MSMCDRCGALVLDEALHDEVHDTLPEYLPVRAFVVDGRIVRIEVER